MRMEALTNAEALGVWHAGAQPMLVAALTAHMP